MRVGAGSVLLKDAPDDAVVVVNHALIVKITKPIMV